MSQSDSVQSDSAAKALTLLGNQVLGLLIDNQPDRSARVAATRPGGVATGPIGREGGHPGFGARPSLAAHAGVLYRLYRSFLRENKVAPQRVGGMA